MWLARAKVHVRFKTFLFDVLGQEVGGLYPLPHPSLLLSFLSLPLPAACTANQPIFIAFLPVHPHSVPLSIAVPIFNFQPYVVIILLHPLRRRRSFATWILSIDVVLLFHVLSALILFRSSVPYSPHSSTTHTTRPAHAHVELTMPEGKSSNMLRKRLCSSSVCKR